MTKYRVTEITGWFWSFIDEEIEAEDSIEAKEDIMYQIMDNIGNYIDIELEEIEEDEEVEEDGNI